jgi:fused signal recognition particle receptor
VDRMPGRGSGLGTRLRAVFGGGRAGSVEWDEAEEALIGADLGPQLAATVVTAARERAARDGAPATDALAAELRSLLAADAAGVFEPGPSPAVILLVGVNGTGKTTTAAKLAARFQREGRSVILAAADTFRPGAVEQLRLWGDRLGLPVVAQRPGADPAAVAFDAVAAAEARGTDVVIVDTAGRLQTSRDLMAELAKIRRVIERQHPDQPRHVLLVLDATIGQNGLSQAESFLSDAGVTGIILAKLDGTAKGGVALAVQDRYGIPIVFTGFGEELDDLTPFNADAYIDWLLAP